MKYKNTIIYKKYLFLLSIIKLYLFYYFLLFYYFYSYLNYDFLSNLSKLLLTTRLYIFESNVDPI